ncbi:dihydrofolate reductase family protein [Pseudarthrobacter sp. O4]|uniref:dihydrofolate reductase family protein n=1 Tax=Pseudarthrobacter sp. O4 TaxID=3418417 RepID=UPI003CF70091
MGKLTVTAFTTLDNVAEEPQLWSGQFFSDATGTFNNEVLAEADSMLLGRVTYDGFAAAWPSQSGDPIADKFNAMPKYVVSTTLERADWNNSTIIAEDIPRRVRALRERENVIVWGSPTLVKTLMEENLVDEYVLLVSPIVLGHGKKMLPEHGTQHTLRIIEQRLLEGGMLALRMMPVAAESRES